MPMLEFDIEHSYDEFKDCLVKTGRLKDFKIKVMFERIKFRIDEVGAKVEN
jgi:hypothetical protein